MRIFLDALNTVNPSSERRQWWVLLYDQLTIDVEPLRSIPAAELGIILVESRWKAKRRLVHKQKLLAVLGNQRQFALELVRMGVAVDYRAGQESYAELLAEAVDDKGPLHIMRPAEREVRQNLAPLFHDGRLIEHAHGGWLTTEEQFKQHCGSPPWRMDAFYRGVRRDTGLLMEDGKPLGGRFSHDGDNRKPWKGEPALPTPPVVRPDAITTEVIDTIQRVFSHHPGQLKPEWMPTTGAQVESWWAWVLEECMEHFGPYEDAMTTASTGLFHTRISPLLNLHRITPERVIADIAALDIPLNSKEGFIRQVLGWREFVHHVHEASDGFRHPGMTADVMPGDTELPPVFWGGSPSGLQCLDAVVKDVWEEGYSHHITRLMVLSNVGMLLDINTRELTDWFWVAYSDAYEWVVEPNVLGMGTFATGELMTTKPYIAGSGYVHRMSDYCKQCTFHPKKSCPLTPMYWAYLNRHDERLSQVQRITRQLWSARKRSAEKQAHDAAVYETVRRRLVAGETVTPEDFGVASATTREKTHSTARSLPFPSKTLSNKAG